MRLVEATWCLQAELKYRSFFHRSEYMIQINEQLKECLLSLISKQNALIDRGESMWFGNLLMEQ